MPPNILASCRSISKSFTHHPLFRDISLVFHAGERLGLIGPNGSGKSTLLKILAGLEPVDSGEVVRQRGVRVVYLPQADAFPADATVEEVLHAAAPAPVQDMQHLHRAGEVAGRVGFDDLAQPVATLSGGWRKRLSLARSLMQEPDLLLLDEPTNHLDLEAILWLETFLVSAPFAFALVSHDRAFLESVTSATVELNRIYPDGYLRVEGPYSAFLEKRQEFLAVQGRQEAALANKVRREIAWLRRGPKARTTKAKSRKDAAQRLVGELEEVNARTAGQRQAGIAFDGTGRRSKKLLQARGLGMRLGGKALFEGLDFTLSPGSCLGVMGPNGSGKSSLMRLLMGELDPDAGQIRRADGLRMVLFDQKREQLDPDQSLKEALCPSGDTVVFRDRALHVMAWASRFLFTPEQLPLPVSLLSGGEQSRLLIARLMLKTADVLLLDEPTNDIDIPTLEMLEQSLEDFPGAVVLITHDRFMLDSLSDRLLHLDGRGSARFFADVDQCLAARQQAETPPDTTAKPAPQPRRAPQRKLSYKDQRELEAMEATIEQAEAEAAALKTRLQAPENAANAALLTDLSAQLEAAEAEVARLYDRWEALEALRLRLEQGEG